MGRINIILPDGIEGMLKDLAEENTRTLTGEILHRIKMGLNIIQVSADRVKSNETPLISQPNWNTAPLGGDYSEIISFIEKINDDDYQGTPEDLSELRRLEKEYGVKWNNMKGALEKQTKDGFVIVWKK